MEHFHTYQFLCNCMVICAQSCPRKQGRMLSVALKLLALATVDTFSIQPGILVFGFHMHRCRATYAWLGGFPHPDIPGTWDSTIKLIGAENHLCVNRKKCFQMSTKHTRAMSNCLTLPPNHIYRAPSVLMGDFRCTPLTGVGENNYNALFLYLVINACRSVISATLDIASFFLILFLCTCLEFQMS